MNLKKELKDKLARAQAIVAGAEQAGREFTADEQTQFDALSDECDKLKATIDKAEKLQAMNASMSELAPRQTVASSVIQVIESDETKAMAGFAHAGEFASAVHQVCTGGQMDDRLNKMLEASGAGGVSSDGFEIPDAMRSQIWEDVREDNSDILSRVTTEVTSANAVEYLKDSRTPWEAAGITPHWETGGKKFEPTHMNKLTSAKCELNGLSVFVVADEDLLTDAPRLGSRLMDLAPKSISWTLNEAVRFGDGVGKPEGYMNSGALITVAKESSQKGGTVTDKNLAKMLSHLSPSEWAYAHWEMNSELLPELILLKDDHGRPLLTPLDRGFEGLPAKWQIFGIPVVFSEHATPLGEVGDVQLISPRSYYMPMRAGVEYADSIHLYFDQAKKAFRWRTKVGGQTFTNAPFKAAKGDHTTSSFVTLAARK